MRTGSARPRPHQGRRGRGRRTALLLTAALLLAACSGQATDDVAGADSSVDPRTDPDLRVDPGASAPPEDAEAPAWPWDRAADGETVPASVPLEEIQPGGPPPDGIPPIDDPQFEDVDAAAEWLEPVDPVLLVQAGGESRAYPLAILTYHEIVNDEVGGEPLVVTYCPLCNSALVFRRVVDGEPVSFGTSGRLYQSNLVMYDRPTRSLWSQFTGEAIVGDLLGTELERLPAAILSFGELAEQRPDVPVLSRDTGADRPYGDNPYPGYEGTQNPFLFDGEVDDRLAVMERVVAVGGAQDPAVWPLEALRSERVLTDEVAGRTLTALWTGGTASALDERQISEGVDVGATRVVVAEVDGDPLQLRPAGEETFTDEATGSTWTILGEAVDGPLEGTTLEAVEHDDTFWFVQQAFRPETRVLDST